jgi:hypothetical protein
VPVPPLTTLEDDGYHRKGGQMKNTHTTNPTTLLTRGDIEGLLAERPGPHVSIYLPTHRASLEFRQDPIRLENLLREAEAQLGSHGSKGTEVDELLEPARELLANDLFWEHQGEGLAVLLAGNQAHFYRLPVSVDEIAVVDDRFHIKPLLPLLGKSRRFWVLALSQKSVRLFNATPYAMRELDELDVPQGLREVVGYDFEERSLQFRTGAGPSGMTRRRAMFHGHGEGVDDIKAEVTEFLRAVDAGVAGLLRNNGNGAPLVLAAVDYEIAIYQSISSYPHIVAGGIVGNPEHVDPADLHAAAWQLVQPLFAEDCRAAGDRYRALAGTGTASADVREIVPAAFDGRVGVLFVATDEYRWGHYDPEARKVETHDERVDGDRDLLEVAAARSLTSGAEIHAVPAAELPADSPIAAIYRY